jgi:uncharacterized protein
MQCPIDGSQLVMTERSGVEIDYCPQCRGVWLDRGELDKIIERSAAPRPRRPPAVDRRASGRSRAITVDRDVSYGDGQFKRKKRGGFLDDLFDF